MDDEKLRQMIGRKVARLRKKARLSQGALGKKVGVGQSMISQIELGARGIPDDWLAGLARALGVAEAELLPESLAPEAGYARPGDLVSSVEDVDAWRNQVLLDTSLDEDSKLILALLAAPIFLNRRSWMVLTTIDQFVRETGRSRELVERRWRDVISSPYVEREGEVEWSFWLKFPE